MDHAVTPRYFCLEEERHASTCSMYPRFSVLCDNSISSIELYPDGSSSVPVVYARFPTSTHPSAPLALVLSYGTEFFWDEIIASFLILEEAIRAEEADTTSSTFHFSDSF